MQAEVAAPARASIVDGRDFGWLWAAFTASELGAALGLGALPVVAILGLHASDLQVSLLAVFAGVVSAAVALPAGPWIEYRRKRPVMIGGDIARFVALGSVPFAAAFGMLTYVQLCLVAVVQAAGTIGFNAASGAHLKALVPEAERVAATSRFESTFWTVNSIGPAVGGALVSAVGTTASVATNAVGYLFSAFGIGRIRRPEPPPPARGHGGAARQITDGWRYILAHAGLRALFANAMLFGGCIMAASPLIAVLMLRELGFPAWQYGLVLGVSRLGGVLGSIVAKPLTRRLGARAVLLGGGVGRALWLGFIPLAPPGPLGLVVVLTAETLLLLCAGVFNPTFATYRMNHTADGYLARVVLAWSVSAKFCQPVVIAAAGLLAGATSPRFALLVLAAGLVAGVALLPWRRAQGSD